MPDETLPTIRDEGNLEIRADAVPERRFAAENIRMPLPPAVYERIGQFSLTAEQEAILDEPLDEDEIDIRPNDGLIYCSHEYCRRMLNKAFGRLQWTLVPGSPMEKEPGTSRYYRVWILFIGGVYVSETMAAREYYTDNSKQDLSDVAESIKSDCIRRLCKDIGIAHEMWNKGYAEKWRKKHAVQVVAPVKSKGQVTNQRVWRRIDREPFEGELGTVVEMEQKARTSSARTAGNSSVKNNPVPPGSTAPAAAPSQDSAGPAGASSSGLNATGSGQEGTERMSSDSDTPQSPTRSSPAQPMRGGLLPQQERAIWARARAAGLVNHEDANALIDLLVKGGYTTIVPLSGKSSTENCAAMFKGIAGVKLAALLKQIDASKVAKPDQVETI